MIKDREPISMSESLEYVSKDDEKGKEVIGFLRKFVKLDSKKAKELRDKLQGLELMKLREEDISKIIDALPETAAELNKIFSEISLDEEEIKKILDMVKELK